MAETFDAPQSPIEAILQNMLGAENVLREPESRNEDLLQQILVMWQDYGGLTPEEIAAAVEAYLEDHPIEAPVTSVNGDTGDVVITAEDLGALTSADLDGAIDTALAEAKASGEFDGADGTDGTNGTDGISPTVSITDITGGHRVTITDANGTQTFDVMDGTDGTDGTNGTNGTDGTSAGFGTPTATVDSNVGTPGVTITASGPDTAKVFSFAFTNLKGEPGTNGTDGTNGTNGTNGSDGTTFTPAVSSAGVISWTNDGGKQNPASVDLTVPVIQALKPTVTNVTGTTPSITLADNTIFSAGTLTSLTVTGSLNEGQIAVIVFTSGSTATQLTMPSAIKMPDSFAVEANKTYEISIMGSRGAVQSWT